MWKKAMWKKVLVGVLATMTLGVTGLPAMAADSLKLDGSTSVYPLAQKLVNGYTLAFPNDISFALTQSDSGAGIAAAANGTVDIGNASRDLKATETAQGLVATRIAKDAIVDIVRPSNPVANLTQAQIADIYKGNITNWSQVGGPNATINVYTREVGSGTRDFFVSYFLGGVDTIKATAILKTSTDAVRAAVAADPYGIGYISLGSVNTSVKGLSLDGTAATLANAKSGAYKAVRNFNMVTLGAPTGAEQRFLNYVLSAAGQTIVATGWITVP